MFIRPSLAVASFHGRLYLAVKGSSFQSRLFQFPFCSLDIFVAEAIAKNGPRMDTKHVANIHIYASCWEKRNVQYVRICVVCHKLPKD